MHTAMFNASPRHGLVARQGRWRPLQNHRFTYNEPMSLEACTQALCDIALNFGEGENAMVRSFAPAYTAEPSSFRPCMC